MAAKVDGAARQRLGRSLSIRQVDAGSCNGCELEIHALDNPYYDIERFGFRFVASPRHADVLLVTGPVTLNMQEALKRTYDATPDPKWVVAVGVCAADGGIFAGSYAVVGGVSAAGDRADAHQSGRRDRHDLPDPDHCCLLSRGGTCSPSASAPPRPGCRSGQNIFPLLIFGPPIGPCGDAP